jgi:hypothetical protein
MSETMIEHWRDGDCIKRVALSSDKVTIMDGAARIVFPPGQIVLATDDELHFDIHELIDVLSHVQ